ncbi:unnamed protein product, partial [Iphiclides podalirius]
MSVVGGKYLTILYAVAPDALNHVSCMQIGASGSAAVVYIYLRLVRISEGLSYTLQLLRIEQLRHPP